MDTINEAHLVEFARCPLRVWPLPEIRVDKLNLVVRKTVDWFMAKSFDEAPASLHDTQSMFETYLKRLKGMDLDWVSTSRRVAKKLQDIHQGYSVMQPNTPYELDISGVCLKGSYAVVTRRSNSQSYILRLWDRPREWVETVLDVVSLARWWHYYSREGGGLGIYNLAIHKAGSWVREPSQGTLVLEQLRSLMENVRMNRFYPVPGRYCATCPTRSCLEVLHD